MRIVVSDEEETRLYYIICKIVRICKKYFYNRKYMPNDFWNIDDVVKDILSSSKELKNNYGEIKKNNKGE